MNSRSRSWPLVLALLSCAHQRSYAMAQVDAVRVADGISESEATTMADAYFEKEFGIGCGGALFEGAKDKAWFFQLKVGVAGTPVGTLRIDATTGAIACTAVSPDTCQSYPSLAAFRDQ